MWRGTRKHCAGPSRLSLCCPVPAEPGRAPRPAPPQSLSKGCKLWGAVIEVSPRELVVSLPHGLRGHVAYAEASDWLHELSKKAAAEAAAEAEAEAEAEERGGAAAGGTKRKARGAAAALPHLADLFHIGQLVRCTVSALRAGGGAAKGGKGEGQPGAKGGQKKRVDLTLRVSKMNAALGELPRWPGCYDARRGCGAVPSASGFVLPLLTPLTPPPAPRRH